jgi:glycerol-3-phosphate acyltransferase PlsY
VNLPFFLTLLLAYGLGSIPTAVIVGKILGVDVRRDGSGNPGAANLARLSGRRSWGAFVLVIDAAKGFLPASFGGALLATLAALPENVEIQTANIILGAAAILGHCTSIFLKFHGGKGVATSLGVALAVSPLIGLFCFVIWAVLAELTRRISVSSLLAGLAFPLFMQFHPEMHQSAKYFAWILPLFLLFTHRLNLLRLLRGTEPSIPKERLVRYFFASRMHQK